MWEFKLAEDRNDAPALAALNGAGLKATTCIPGVLSVFPVPFPGPTDPAERTVELCRAIERFAPFQPEVILTVTGPSGRRRRPRRGAARCSSTACARPPASPRRTG